MYTYATFLTYPGSRRIVASSCEIIKAPDAEQAQGERAAKEGLPFDRISVVQLKDQPKG